MRTVITLALLALPLAARSEEPAKPDFSQCKSLGYPGMFSGSLNDKGDFDVDAGSPGVSIDNSLDGNVKSVAVKNPWLNGMSATYVLTKKDGRPDRMEMKWDMSKLKLPKGFPKQKNPAIGTFTSYSYAGTHCYVSQSGMLTKSGKEIVTYDFEACRNLLDVVKKYGAKKLNECSKAITEMEMSIKRSEMKVNGENRELHLGSYGMSGGYGDWDSSKLPFFQSVSPITAALGCSMTRKMYGMEVDPQADLLPGGAFVGGMGGGITGEGISATPSTDDEGLPKLNEKAQ